MLHVCVIIPYRGSADTLRWVLDGFAGQRLPPEMSVEVRVGGDGCSPPELNPPPSDTRIKFTAQSLPRCGAAVARNLLLEGVQSDVLIFVNSDTRPRANFVAAHVQRLLSLPENFMVLGSAPYESAAAKTVFDAFKEETPAIFFYDDIQPHRCYDYRYVWTLNMSVRRGDFRRAGGFDWHFRPYGYEDLDFGYRLMGAKAAVYYEPAAEVTHRHPMSLEQYLDREEGLGTMAPVLSHANPRIFQSLFGSRTLEELAGDYRVWTSLDGASHRWIYQRLCDWAAQPDGQLGLAGSGERRRMMLTLYQMHLPLKRLAFRLGFLRGLELLDDSRWLERGSQGLWKLAIR